MQTIGSGLQGMTYDSSDDTLWYGDHFRNRAGHIDKNGNVNLSPLSYFNLFSVNPPIMIFSPSRRGRDNTTKHTLENVLEVKETVINIVNYDMVEQMSL